jgi:hypothetical protein
MGVWVCMSGLRIVPSQCKQCRIISIPVEGTNDRSVYSPSCLFFTMQMRIDVHLSHYYTHTRTQLVNPSPLRTSITSVTENFLYRIALLHRDEAGGPFVYAQTPRSQYSQLSQQRSK